MSKNLYVIVGPSGVGKTYTSDYLQQKGLVKVRSSTTRCRRDGEGDDYFFVTEEQFFQEKLVEYTKFAGNYYGIQVSQLPQGDYCIVDTNGVQALCASYLDRPVIVIGITAPQEVLEQRLSHRSTDGISRIQHDIRVFENMSPLCDIIFDGASSSLPEDVLNFILKLEEKTL